MERLDEKFEKLPQQAPLLTDEPSHYVRSCPIYFSCELEEKILPYVISLGLQKRIMYPSDYPHERRLLTSSLLTFLGFEQETIYPMRPKSLFCATTARSFTRSNCHVSKV